MSHSNLKSQPVRVIKNPLIRLRHVLVCLLSGLLLGLPLFATGNPANPEAITATKIRSQSAIVHELEGLTRLLKIDRASSAVKLNQRLLEGNILDIKPDSLVEITYNNGCSEIVNKVKKHKVDSCACQTSPFRKGIKDQFNATLKEITGEVLIFQGDKYVPAKPNMRIRNGDRIMAMRDSAAKISYDTGCKQDVAAFSIHDVDGCSTECPLQRLVERPLPNQPAPSPPAPAPPTPVPAVAPPVPVPTPIPPTVIPPPIPPTIVVTIIPPLLPPPEQPPPDVSP